MEQNNLEGIKIVEERFGKDNVIAFGTIDGDYPAIRYVNAYYEDGAFYVITYALSNKMQQIGKNPNISLCAEWFTAKGKGVNLGYFGKKENEKMAAKLRAAFASWIDNGHNNFDDENTIILKVELEDAVLWSNGTRYELHYS